VNYAPLYVLDERLESRPVDLSWWRSQINVRTVVMTMTAFKVAPIRPTISADVLDKIDIRVGTIELVEDVEGSEKLVKLTVDFGDHKRSILVGMKQERENPKEIEGKQALFVVNLEPKRMMGQVSEGMLFDIGYADGIKPVLAVPENRVRSGARAG
jgi:methionine--tRNA ligase beta chain